MGTIFFVINLLVIVGVFYKRGAMAGCFSIPVAIISSVWIGIAASNNANIANYLIPLLLTAVLVLVIFKGGDRANTAKDKSGETEYFSGPTIAERRAQDLVQPATMPVIVEVKRDEYLPDTDDAADLAARKLDEDLENGIIDRATYVAERKKLAGQ
jgi:hypothetical protein